MVDSVTVYLMKASVTEPSEILREDAQVTEIALRDDLSYPGMLFVEPRAPGAPGWLEFAQSVAATPLPHVATQFPAAALAIKVDGRVLVFTFGLGRTLLELDLVEPDFGLRVTLNTVDPEQLESLDTAVMEDLVIRTRRQLSKAATTSAFGIDDTRDMFRALVGRPRDPDLGRRVGGSNSLN